MAQFTSRTTGLPLPHHTPGVTNNYSTFVPPPVIEEERRRAYKAQPPHIPPKTSAQLERELEEAKKRLWRLGVRPR
jgi:hypothetical protein